MRSPWEPLWVGAARSVRPKVLRRAILPAFLPRVPPSTVLGPKGPLHRGRGAPNIVKDGTPQGGHARGTRCKRPALRVGHLTPEAAISQRSAAWRARGPRWARCAAVPLPTILRLVRRALVARLVANIVGGGTLPAAALGGRCQGVFPAPTHHRLAAPSAPSHHPTPRVCRPGASQTGEADGWRTTTRW
jgi:hypothetical protein